MCIRILGFLCRIYIRYNIIIPAFHKHFSIALLLHESAPATPSQQHTVNIFTIRMYYRNKGSCMH